MTAAYKSKVDAWLVWLICGVCVLTLWPLMLDTFDALSWAAVSIILLLFAIVIYLLFSIRYIIDGDVLKVKCLGIKCATINIMDITTISRTNTFLSAPAASLDRIAIHTRRHRYPVIISPKNRDKFIADLQSINLEIAYKG